MLFTTEEMAPRIPDNGWTTPAVFPRLDAAKRIAIDLETKDPLLLTKGPGEIRGDGHICGVGVGVDTGERWYFPMRHEFGGGNMNPDMVLNWCRDELTRPHQEKVGANIMYDVSWLRAEGVHVAGTLRDVSYAEALLNENARSYSLNAIAKKWLNEGKSDDALYKWLAATYGGKPTRRQQGGRIHMAPAQLVGPYCEGDVDLPLRAYDLQRKELEAQGLLDLFDMESKLTPLLLDMRWHGVRVDEERAGEVSAIIHKKTDDAQAILNDAAGCEINADSNNDIAAMFDRQGIKYPTTAAGNPSFVKEWLEQHDSPLAQNIVAVRKYAKAVSTFIDGGILSNVVNGRIHGQFHPLKSDENGTVTGRFSSSTPNLQNFPSRDKELASLIRSLFIPNEGHPNWRRYDYSQIEYRLLAHYAKGAGADDVRQQYLDNPRTDFHEMVRQLVFKVTGNLLDRKPTKNINFGLCYGMGKPKLIRQLGLSQAAGDKLFNAYHTGAPFVRETYEAAMSTAKTRGYVKTLLGRRRRFDFWEPRQWSEDKEKPRSYDAAVNEWGENAIQRAGAHAALNAVLQGSSADIIKLAMVTAYEAGIFDVIGVPLVTVHDELDHSDDGTPEAAEAFKELQHTMETCTTLKVPVLADAEVGPNWGNLQEAA